MLWLLLSAPTLSYNPTQIGVCMFLSSMLLNVAFVHALDLDATPRQFFLGWFSKVWSADISTGTFIPASPPPQFRPLLTLAFRSGDTSATLHLFRSATSTTYSSAALTAL